MKQSWKIISIAIAAIIVVVAGIYIYKIIYRPPKVDPVAQEIQAVQNEVIRDRIVIKEVVRDAKQEAINKVTVMPDDVVAVEWNERLRKYRDGKSQ